MSSVIPERQFWASKCQCSNGTHHGMGGTESSGTNKDGPDSVHLWDEEQTRVEKRGKKAEQKSDGRKLSHDSLNGSVCPVSYRDR